MKEKISLNNKEILDHQQNKPPYLMIDEALEIIPGESAKGYKELKNDEWFFKVHWENDPNMPGMLQLEAITQISSLAVLTLPNNSNKTMYLATMNNIRFYKKVIPNDKILISSEIIYSKGNFFKFSGNIKVKKTLVCNVDFAMLLND